MTEDPAGFEARLRRDLVTLAESAPNVPARLDAIDEHVVALRGRFVQRRRLVIGGAAAAGAAAAGVWGMAVFREPEGQQVTVGPIPEDPTGRREWARIPVAPLSPRRSPATVWAGTELIVWGGVGASDYLLPPDGARWRPGSESWEPMAPGPAGAIGGGFAVWNGEEMFVGLTEGDATAPWNPERPPAEALYGIAGYSPQADTWRYIAPVEDSDQRLRSQRQAVWTPAGLLVAVRTALPGAAGHERDLVLVDTTSGQRTELPAGPFAASPYPDASGEVTLTSVGDLVVAIPNWDLRPWVLDPATRQWRQADGPPAATSLHLLPAVAAGPKAFLFESDGRRPWLFDANAQPADAWTSAAAAPPSDTAWGYQPVWSGTEIFIPGHAYSITSDAWRPIDPPPRGPDRQRLLQARWTGTALLLFAGEEYTCPDSASCDRSPGNDTLDGWILPDP